MYREAWRLQTEQFWVEDMSDIDWDRVYDRYAALLPRVRTRGELSDLIWEMQGELGTSHAYEWGGDYRVPPQYQRGFLGADFAWDDDARRLSHRAHLSRRFVESRARFAARRARPETCAKATLSSRSAASASRATSRPTDCSSTRPDKDVSVTLRTRKDEERTVLVKGAGERSGAALPRVGRRETAATCTSAPAGASATCTFPTWVRGDSPSSTAAISASSTARACIVDVRYNRGGHVSPLLLEKLARKRIGYDAPRYGAPVPYPPESVGGPMVALTNQFAGSDGDIFSHCFKLYKLGPLVGKRTWGGVIGIDPYHHLVDGTLTTQPEFSFWFVDVGWGVENYGTDPDYDVDIAPHDYRDGNDPQMELALCS